MLKTLLEQNCSNGASGNQAEKKHLCPFTDTEPCPADAQNRFEVAQSCGCADQPQCGGCCFRHLDIADYRRQKAAQVKKILDTGLPGHDYEWESPVFLPDGTRRRAAFAFERHKNGVRLGFNAWRSGEIADCAHCPLLTAKINEALPLIRSFISRLCSLGIESAAKGKNFSSKHIKSSAKNKNVSRNYLEKGDILVLDADNGLDIVLEADIRLNLDIRMEILDFVNQADNVIRFSFRRQNADEAETVIEKLKPMVKIADYEVFVAPGMFLQPSKQGEEALGNIVRDYLGDVPNYLGGARGHIADLFCGIGTFSYPQAAQGNKITAVDSNKALLEGFRQSAHRQMLHQVEIVQRNLFKYPLSGAELAKFDAVIFDPPRAGAQAQAKEIAAVSSSRPLRRVVAVSCNPHSFIKDAAILIEGGYKLEKIRMVDQFVFSNHSELVALFTK